MIRPSTKLEWATTNPVNPTSGIAAIVEPSSGKKQTGFLRLEKPPRQDVNWLHNLAGKWTQFFDRRVSSTFLEGFSLQSIIQSAGETEVTYTHGACALPSNYSINSQRATGTVALSKKLITAGVIDPWVAGSGNGGWYSTTSIDDTSFIYVFVMYFASTDSIDIAFTYGSDGADLSGIPGVTEVRRIGCLYFIDLASGLLEMSQNGDYFSLKNSVSGFMTIVNPSDTTMSFFKLPAIDHVANISLRARVSVAPCSELWVVSDLSEVGADDWFASKDTIWDPVYGVVQESKLLRCSPYQQIRVYSNGTGEWSLFISLTGYFDYRGKE